MLNLYFLGLQSYVEIWKSFANLAYDYEWRTWSLLECHRPSIFFQQIFSKKILVLEQYYAGCLLYYDIYWWHQQTSIGGTKMCVCVFHENLEKTFCITKFC